MNTVKLEKTTLVHRPTMLMFSLHDRVIPRFRVLQILRSKQLLKKEPNFNSVLCLNGEEFVDKFILKYADNVEELLVAYRGIEADEWESKWWLLFHMQGKRFLFYLWEPWTSMIFKPYLPSPLWKIMRWDDSFCWKSLLEDEKKALGMWIIIHNVLEMKPSENRTQFYTNVYSLVE